MAKPLQQRVLPQHSTLLALLGAQTEVTEAEASEAQPWRNETECYGLKNREMKIRSIRRRKSETGRGLPFRGVSLRCVEESNQI